MQLLESVRAFIWTISLDEFNVLIIKCVKNKKKIVLFTDQYIKLNLTVRFAVVNIIRWQFFAQRVSNTICTRLLVFGFVSYRPYCSSNCIRAIINPYLRHLTPINRRIGSCQWNYTTKCDTQTRPDQYNVEYAASSGTKGQFIIWSLEFRIICYTAWNTLVKSYTFSFVDKFSSTWCPYHSHKRRTVKSLI